MNDDAEIYAHYLGETDVIRFGYGALLEGEYVDVDIREAVFLRYQLDGAIRDYEKAVGR